MENKQKLNQIFLTVGGIILIVNLVVLDVAFLFRDKKEPITPISVVEKVREVVGGPKVEEVAPDFAKASTSRQVEDENLRLICQEEIAKALATISSQPKEIIKTVYQEPSTPSHPSIVYVPLGGGSSTTTRDWQDSGSAEAYFDKADYPGVKKISFEVFLKVKHGAGQADVRLYDATHGFVIADSELLAGSEQFEKKSTGSLNLLPGNNLYKVQLRSTTGYEAFMEGPRLKIEY